MKKRYFGYWWLITAVISHSNEASDYQVVRLKIDVQTDRPFGFEESKNRAAAVALGLGTAQGGLAGTAGKLQLRERTAGAAGQAAAKALELQNAPEWLRPLLMLLPPVPKRHGTSVKPPPHLTEMALSTLRANPLPESRPESSNNGASRLKRGRENDGDSSDEENGKTAGGGYSNQFRARQQARLVSASS